MAIEKLKEKASWQLYAGANDVDFETANEISKALDKYNEKLKYASDEEREFIVAEDYIPKEYIGIYKESLEYQGITINGKAHACGFLLLDKDIRREVGLIRMVSESTGKSVLCATIEGSYLDDFGYVKNDFLIVDSVDLTDKFFKSIGREVPSFDELREMIRDDKPTWDIYAKGITCCINQCEKPSTTKKAMEYQMTNLAESSAFIAGIRPGFRSLIRGFLAREEYTTGVPQLDELLKDSYCYLLYQESIMKLFSYLGLSMGKCYETIKKISKKKFKEKELDELKRLLKKGWEESIGDTSKFEETWETVDNFAKYGFNAPHSLSMGGDSAYEAWFKAHHTSKFYEVAINHYMEKNKKKKIEDLMREAIKHFDYKLGEYKFGKDNRSVTVDDNEKVIYPSLSNLKGFGVQVASNLYEVSKKKKYNDFIELYKDMGQFGLGRAIIEKLIIIDYFKDFGKSQYLLDVIDIIDKFANAKVLSKDNLTKYNINSIKKYCKKETAKQLRDIDNERLVFELCKSVQNKDIHLKAKISTEIEIMGYPNTKLVELKEPLYYVLKIDSYKNAKSISYYTTLYNIKDGEEVRYRVDSVMTYLDYPFKEGDVINITEESTKPKKKNIGTKEKPDWVNVEGEYNNMLKWWEVY